jgi:hypothetical protein
VPDEGQTSDLSTWAKLLSYALLVPFLLLYGSVFAGFLFESRTAALLALFGFLVMLASHVGGAVWAYRQTMRREWPQVGPLDDDDEWD